MAVPTDDQALHFIFPQDIHPKHLADHIVVLVRASTSGHDAQLAGGGLQRAIPVAIKLYMLVLEAAHKLEALVDAVRLEADEVETATGLCGMRLTREVDELG